MCAKTAGSSRAATSGARKQQVHSRQERAWQQLHCPTTHMAPRRCQPCWRLQLRQKAAAIRARARVQQPEPKHLRLGLALEPGVYSGNALKFPPTQLLTYPSLEPLKTFCLPSGISPRSVSIQREGVGAM